MRNRDPNLKTRFASRLARRFPSRLCLLCRRSHQLRTRIYTDWIGPKPHDNWCNSCLVFPHHEGNSAVTISSPQNGASCGVRKPRRSAFSAASRSARTWNTLSSTRWRCGCRLIIARWAVGIVPPRWDDPPYSCANGSIIHGQCSAFAHKPATIGFCRM